MIFESCALSASLKPIGNLVGGEMGLFSDYLSVKAFVSLAFLVVFGIFALLITHNKLTRVTEFLIRVRPGVRILIYGIAFFLFLSLLRYVY